MITKEQTIQQIQNLKHGQSWIWPESCYGKAEIWRINDIYIVFGIPMFGGEPFYHGTYYSSQISELVNTVNDWT